MQETLSRLIAAQVVQRTLIADLIDLLPHAQRDQILTRLQAAAQADPGQTEAGQEMDPQHLAQEAQRWVDWFDQKASGPD